VENPPLEREALKRGGLCVCLCKHPLHPEGNFTKLRRGGNVFEMSIHFTFFRLDRFVIKLPAEANGPTSSGGSQPITGASWELRKCKRGEKRGGQTRFGPFLEVGTHGDWKIWHCCLFCKRRPVPPPFFKLRLYFLNFCT
jgi:hypothetical protein